MWTRKCAPSAVAESPDLAVAILTLPAFLPRAAVNAPSAPEHNASFSASGPLVAQASVTLNSTERRRKQNVNTAQTHMTGTAHTTNEDRGSVETDQTPLAAPAVSKAPLAVGHSGIQALPRPVAAATPATITPPETNEEHIESSAHNNNNNVTYQTPDNSALAATSHYARATTLTTAGSTPSDTPDTAAGSTAAAARHTIATTVNSSPSAVNDVRASAPDRSPHFVAESPGLAVAILTLPAILPRAAVNAPNAPEHNASFSAPGPPVSQTPVTPNTPARRRKQNVNTAPTHKTGTAHTTIEDRSLEETDQVPPALAAPADSKAPPAVGHTGIQALPTPVAAATPATIIPPETNEEHIESSAHNNNNNVTYQTPDNSALAATSHYARATTLTTAGSTPSDTPDTAAGSTAAAASHTIATTVNSSPSAVNDVRASTPDRSPHFVAESPGLAVAILTLPAILPRAAVNAPRAPEHNASFSAPGPLVAQTSVTPNTSERRRKQNINTALTHKTGTAHTTIEDRGTVENDQAPPVLATPAVSKTLPAVGHSGIQALPRPAPAATPATKIPPETIEEHIESSAHNNNNVTYQTPDNSALAATSHSARATTLNTAGNTPSDTSDTEILDAACCLP
ncbi:uncharacterized protein [Drosophila virilis]|uniref:uncharacterized protein n=1 Tax=Drosophila virilis TaxID=7244 RepID=UPI001395D9D1|nr:putative GPI-anchored protein pfl2 [Drosophila virilis]